MKAAGASSSRISSVCGGRCCYSDGTARSHSMRLKLVLFDCQRCREDATQEIPARSSHMAQWREIAKVKLGGKNRVVQGSKGSARTSVSHSWGLFLAGWDAGGRRGLTAGWEGTTESLRGSQGRIDSVRGKSRRERRESEGKRAQKKRKRGTKV